MNLIRGIIEVLNEQGAYAILRNHEGLPDKVASRDIDIIISQKDYVSVKKKIYRAAKDAGYDVLLVSRNDRFHSIFFQRDTELIQFDFFFGISAFGVLMMTAEEVLAYKQFNGEVYYLPIMQQFLEKYLYNTMAGQPYPEKYSSIRERVCTEQAAELAQQLSSVFGPDCGTLEQVEKLPTKVLRRQAKAMSLRKYGVGQIRQGWQFTLSRVGNYLAPQGLFISFTGPDGVGKTTVLEQVAEVYSTVWRDEAVLVKHFRPSVLPRIASLLKKAGAKQEVDEDYSKPHRGRNSSGLSSLVRLFYYMLDYQIGYLKQILPRRYRRQVTIFDRYYSDIIIDCRRSNISLPKGMIYFLGGLVPQPTYRLLLVADRDIIASRKAELTGEEIDSLLNSIQWLAGKSSHYYLVENNGGVEEAKLRILNTILREQDRKNEKYFR